MFRCPCQDKAFDEAEAAAVEELMEEVEEIQQKEIDSDKLGCDFIKEVDPLNERQIL